MKKSMIFYREWLDAVKDLPREVQGEVLTAIIEYGLDGVTTEPLKPITRAMLSMVKGRLDLNRERFANGLKGGRPREDKDESEINTSKHKNTYIIDKKPNHNQSVTKPEPNINQTETNQEPNRNQTVTKPEPPIYNNIILSPKVDNISSLSDDKEAFAPAYTRGGIPFKEIQDLWNETCTGYPKLIKLTDARKNKIRIRLAEMGGVEQGMQTLATIFQRLQESKFLKGENKRGWKATFDWVFENDKNWVKVWEGNYEGPVDHGSSSSSASDNVNNIWNDGTN